jgi:hypothetical protein
MTHRGARVNHPDFAAKPPQNDPLIQEDGLRDSRRVVGPVECGTAAVEDELFGDKGMRDFLSSPKIIATVAMLAAAAGGCAPSQLPEFGSVKLIPSVGNLSRPDWLTYSGAKDEFALRPITAADLVSAEGQCAMAAAEAPATPDTADGMQQQASLLPGGIALQMTECDVVRRAGAPEQIQIGADERGERSVVITYIRGPRPGIYRFAAGRLASIERAPEAPGAKAAPKAKPSKKAARS